MTKPVALTFLSGELATIAEKSDEEKLSFIKKEKGNFMKIRKSNRPHREKL